MRTAFQSGTRPSRTDPILAGTDALAENRDARAFVRAHQGGLDQLFGEVAVEVASQPTVASSGTRSTENSCRGAAYRARTDRKDCCC